MAVLALNNREFAAAIWLAVFLTWALFQKDVRSSLWSATRAALQPEVLAAFVGLAGWVALEVWAGMELSLWEVALAKDTLFWLVTSAMVLLVNYITSPKERADLLRRNMLGVVGAVAFLEFFLNIAVLSLPIELILQPTVALLAAVSVFASYDEEYQEAENVAKALLSLVVLSLLSYTIVRTYQDRGMLDQALLVRQWLLPVWLTIGLLPLLYSLGVYADYDWAFVKIDADDGDRWAELRAKLALLLELRLSLDDVRAFGWYWGNEITNVDSFAQARAVAAEYKEHRRQERQAALEEEKRLEWFAGSEETDEEGRRLDRREFEETQNALRWLHTCHMGHYDEGDGYRRNLLGLLEGGFQKRGLPEDHGIHIEVSEDGGSWYTWRRTVTGWCFAIGADEAPPNEWLYDGPEPPGGFPGEHPDWGESWLDWEVAPNWH